MNHYKFEDKFIDIKSFKIQMLSLRKANIKDAELLFKWVNEKAVRSNSFKKV